MNEEQMQDEELVQDVPVPESVLNEVAPEQEFAVQEVLMPVRVKTKEELDILKQLDYIKQSASRGLGVENEFLGGTPDILLEAAQSEDKATAIRALQAIAISFDYTPAQRAAASQMAYDYGTSSGPDAPLIDKGASIVKYAAENELIEDGSIDERQDIVEAFRNGDAVRQTNIEMSLDSTRDLAVFREAVAKGGVRYGLSILTDITNARSKLISADTAAGFVPTTTELSTDNFYRQLSRVTPEIGVVLDKYGAIGSVIDRGRRDADILTAVSKLPEAKLIVLAEEVIKLMNDSTLDSVLDHVNADVVDILFRRIVDPKSGQYTLQDVMQAEGVGAAVGTAMRTPAAEWIGREIIRPAFAILDYLPALGVAKNIAVNSAKRILPQMKTTSRFMGIVRPKASTDVAMAAAQSDEAAVAMGYNSREDALLRMMPSERSFFESPDVAYNVQQKVVADGLFRKRMMEELYSVSHTPVNIADPERLVDGYMNEMKGGSIVPHTSYTSITAKDGVFEVNGVFGKTDTEGYKSAAEAAATTKNFFGNVPVVTIFRKRTTGQMIHPEDEAYKSLLKDAKKNPSEYDWWARIDVKQPTWSVESSVIADTSTNIVGRILSGNNVLSRNFTAGLSQLVSSDVLSKGTYAAGTSRFATTQFNKLLGLEGVAPKERQSLSAILYRQNRERDGVLLSSKQLREAGITSLDGQAAYFNIKITLDNVKRLVDNNFAESLTREGFKDVVGADGIRVGFGKPVASGTLKVDTSYNVRLVDAGKDYVITVTGSRLDSMAKKGFSLYENKIAQFAKRTSDEVDVETTHILVANNVKDAQVRNIMADGVVPYSLGYTPEIRTGRVAIEGTSESGRKHIIGFADTISEAKVVVDRLKADPKMAKKFPNGIGQNIYKGMTHDYQAVGKRETYENLNGLVYGQKGDEIQNFSGVNGDATMLDPLEAVEHMTSMLAQQWTKGRHIEYSEGLATSFANKWNLLKPNVSVARTVDDLVERSSLVGDEVTAHKQLTGYLMHIEAQRIAPDMVDRTASAAWSAAANWAAEKQIPFLGRLIEKAAIKQAQNPTNLLQAVTRFNYFTKIRTNPLKHRIMNISSALVNMANPTAMATGLKQRSAFNAAVDFMESTTLSTKQIDDALIPTAKQFGVSVTELKELVKAYREGGVYNAADNNILFRNSLETEAQLVEMRALNGSYKGGDKMAKLDAMWQNMNKALGELGDVAGEREAMLTTFLTQYNVLKGQKGFNIMSQAGKEQLVAKTMVLSGNMVSEGALAMQKGMFRAMFQFHSYSVKMYWNALAPSWLGGSRLLSPKDKYGMVATQLLMFGADAVVGARSAAASLASEWANDSTLSDQEKRDRNEFLVSSGVQRLVENGVIGMFLNNYLKSFYYAWDDKEQDGSEYADFDFAGFMSVTGGASIVENTFRNVMKGFGESALIMSSVGGTEGWWPAAKSAVGTMSTAYLGVNGKTPKNIMDSIMSIGRITGSAYRGEEPMWSPARATARATLEHTVAGARPFINLLVSKRYGQEIANGKPRNRAFEEGLNGQLKAFFGLQTLDEKEAYRLNEAMRNFNAKNYYGSSGYQMEMKKAARSYVDGIVKDLSYLATDTGDRAISLREATLERHGRLLASELASMDTVDAIEYEAAINQALDDAMSKESIEKTVIENALGMMGNDVASYKDFSYIKEIMGESTLIRQNPQALDSYIGFINKWVETTFGDYE